MNRKFLRRFGEWVTGLRADPFSYVRIKLTIIYTLVIILGIIGYVLLLNREFTRYTTTVAQEITDPARRQRFITRSEKVTAKALYSIEPEDILTVFIVMGISYILAGIALKPIREMVENQKVFLANAAHQLKTPLAIIKTEMEVFLRDKRNYLQSPELLFRRKAGVLSNLEEIDRMNHIIEDLMLIARLDSHQITLQRIPINLGRLMKGVIKNLSNYAEMKKISFRFKSAKSVSILGDPEKLQQAFYNILKNAIDCSHQNGLVKVSINHRSLDAIVEIMDQGIGISPNELPFIFDRFYRTSTAINNNIKGTGLGLAIVYWIIKNHQGEITVHSAPSKGTIFKITLPHNG